MTMLYLNCKEKLRSMYQVSEGFYHFICTVRFISRISRLSWIVTSEYFIYLFNRNIEPLLYARHLLKKSLLRFIVDNGKRIRDFELAAEMFISTTFQSSSHTIYKTAHTVFIHTINIYWAFKGKTFVLESGTQE